MLADIGAERAGGDGSVVEGSQCDGCEDLGGTERLEDALSGEGVEVPGGVADEDGAVEGDSPGGPVEGSRGGERELAEGMVGDAAAEAWKELNGVIGEGAGVGGDGAAEAVRIRDEGQVGAAVGGDGCEAGTEAVGEVHLAERRIGGTGKEACCERDLPETGWSADGAEASGEDGAQSIGGDDEPCAPCVTARDHTGDAARSVHQEVRDADAVAEHGAGGNGGVEQRGVEEGALDGERTGDAGGGRRGREPRLERGAPRGDDAPSGQLDVRQGADGFEDAEPLEHAGGAGAQAVAAGLRARERGAVQEQDARAGAGKQQCRGGACRAGAHHDGIVGFIAAGACRERTARRHSASVDVYYADHFVLPLPDGHRFPMRKYARLRERVAAELGGVTLHVPAAATDADLLRVHDAAYVHRVVTGTLAPDEIRRIGFPWSPAMVERSRRSVGATMAAARAALRDGAAVNLAGGTHHAFRDRGEGFCVFNDVAVAVRAMQAEGRAGRCAVVDCDVHQGNGTAALFSGDADVFTFSVHGAANFPFRKEASDLDIALPDGAGDGPYLAAVHAGVEAALRHGPDLVFYLAGADAHEDDRLGRLRVTKSALAARDALVFEGFRRAGIAVAVAMAGGYGADVEDTVDIHFQTVRAALESVRRATMTSR